MYSKMIKIFEWGQLAITESVSPIALRKRLNEH